MSTVYYRIKKSVWLTLPSDFGLLDGTVPYVLILLMASAMPTRIFVTAGPLDAQIEVRLRSELPLGALASTATGADLRASVTPAPQALLVEVRGSRGETLLLRDVAIAGNDDAALRQVVLLLARTYADFTPSTPALTSKSAPADPSEPRWVVEAGAQIVSWKSPKTPQLGLLVAAAYALPRTRLELAARLEGRGFFCCERLVEGLTSDVLELSVLVETRYGIDFGLTVLSVLAAAGFEFMRATVQPIAFSGLAPAQTVERQIPVARIGLGLGFGSHLRAQVRGGAQLRWPSTAIELPARYGAASLDPGLIVPWVEVSVGSRLP